MTRTRIVWGILIAWVAAFGWSVRYMIFVTPEGTGLLRGMNRVDGFTRWQIVAGALALVAFGLSRALPEGSAARQWARPPLMVFVIWVAALLMGGVVAAQLG